MAHLVLTQQLRHFTDAPEVDSAATTLRGALQDAFAATPRVRDYEKLDDALGAASQVHVLRALTGG